MPMSLTAFMKEQNQVIMGLREMVKGRKEMMVQEIEAMVRIMVMDQKATKGPRLVT